MLVPAQDHVDVRGRGEGLVLGHVHVCDRHHEARTLRSEARGRFPADRDGLTEHDIRPGPRGRRAIGRGETEEPDAGTTEREDHLARSAAERPTRAPVDDVGREPAELRLVHALDEDRGAEVELVVAERREVQADRVECRDHLRALEERGLDGRREGVARENEDRVRVLAPDLADERRQPRHPAPSPAIHGLEDVVVVDLQQCQSNEVGVGGPLGQRRTRAEDDRDDDAERGAGPRTRHRAAVPISVAVRFFQKWSGRRATRSASRRSARFMSPALKHASSSVS